MNLFTKISLGVIDVKESFPNDNPKAIVYLNPFTYNYFRKNLNEIKNVEYFRFDGFFMTSLLKVLGVNVKERQSFDFTSLAPFVFEKCENKNISIYVCGGSGDDVECFVKEIKSKFLNLKVVGYSSGYFSDDEEKINHIVAHAPGLVLLGLGGIKQEAFASKLKPRVPSHIFTCGAFISQTASKKDYYPKFVRKYGFRWLYRFYKEPHVMKRVFLHYPVFVINLLFDFVSHVLSKNNKMK